MTVDQTWELSLDRLAALYLLDSLRGMGPQKFKVLWDADVDPDQVLKSPDLLPVSGKLGEKLRIEMRKVSSADVDTCKRRAERQIEAARKYGASILTYWDSRYPANLLKSNYPVPVLYVRGDVHVLENRKSVACVGSRKIRSPYDSLHRMFCETSVDQGFVITSGFAQGADTIGHEAAIRGGGHTICVMPGGLDRPFPPENRPVWTELLDRGGAAFVSEFGFYTTASALTLRKRNKMIVGASLGVLVSQSSQKGGAMNAYRFAIEQKKPMATFEPDGSEESSGNEQIRAESKVPTRVFSMQESGSIGFSEWLRELSSSI